MKSKIFILFLLLFLLFNKNLNSFENKIIIKIDNDIITSLDLENEINYLITLNPNLKQLKMNEIIEISKKSIIQERIKKTEIFKNFENPKLPSDFLEELIKNIYIKIGIQDLKQFKEFVKSNNVEYNDILDKIEIEALWNELIVIKFSNKIKINENELIEKIKKNLNKKSKTYLMSEIFFEVSKEEDLYKKYDEISNMINKKGFGNAALKYSISESSNIGGKLDWVNENNLNKNIRKQINSIQVGEYSKPIQVPGGFLILQINEIKILETKNDFEKELKKNINIIKNNQFNQFSKMYFNRIKKNVRIDEI